MCKGMYDLFRGYESEVFLQNMNQLVGKGIDSMYMISGQQVTFVSLLEDLLHPY